MNPYLRLYEDVLVNGAEMSLPPQPRMIFVVHGSVAAADRTLRDEGTFSGEGPVTVTAGSAGATLWRWELGGGRGRRRYGPWARHGLARESLRRGSRRRRRASSFCAATASDFRPGGCAYLHRHQGPGIRCVIAGGIRIDTHGRSTSYGPGGAWYETGPDAVFAQAADRPTRFIRVMILPRAYLGKSSIEYLNEEDKAKPKSQAYKIFVDMPLTLAPVRDIPDATNKTRPAMRIIVAAVGRLKQGPERELAAAYRKRAEAIGRAFGLRASRNRRNSREPRAGCRTPPCRGIDSASPMSFPSRRSLSFSTSAATTSTARRWRQRLREWREEDRPAVCFIIGGADGLAQNLRDRAKLKLAFGAATWPHQLVRIMLLEQLYRAGDDSGRAPLSPGVRPANAHQTEPPRNGAFRHHRIVTLALAGVLFPSHDGPFCAVSLAFPRSASTFVLFLLRSRGPRLPLCGLSCVPEVRVYP